MVVQIFVEIVICCFAFLGIYGAVLWLTRRLFGSRSTVLAIEILTQRDADSAEVLIRDALFSAMGLPSGRIAVMVTEELWENEQLQSVLARYGVSRYCIRNTEKQCY